LRHQFLLACFVALIQLYAGYQTADRALHKTAPRFDSWWKNSNIAQYRIVRRFIVWGGYGMLFACGVNPLSWFPFTLIPGYPCHWQGVSILRATRLKYGASILAVGAICRLALLYGALLSMQCGTR
jgi:hypothetical protein